MLSVIFLLLPLSFVNIVGAQDVDVCSSNPCRNGGTCNNLVGYYDCTCRRGYTGRNCQIDTIECLSNPCLNGGTCNERVGYYDCTCRNGYTGSNCETETNECEPNPCIRGNCTDLINDYKCKCEAGYEGENCAPPKAAESNTGPIVGAIIGAGVIMGVFGLIGFCWWKRRTAEQSGTAVPSTRKRDMELSIVNEV